MTTQATDYATLTPHPSIERVAILTLNRPDKRNALSIELIAQLQAHADHLKSREDLNALIITGAGRSFCAGMDLKAVLSTPGAPLQLLQGIAELSITLRNLPLVTIAKVNGAAIGGGCGLVATADIAITHPDAKLGYPEVDLGVCPAVVAPWLVNAIGAGPARRILLQGGTLSGLQAHNLGLASHMAPKEELDAATDDIASRLSAAGPQALRATKALLNELEAGEEQRLYALVRKGAHISAEVIAGPEAQSRLSAIYG